GVRPICCRTEQNRVPEIPKEWSHLSAIDQREHASAEAGAHDSGAVAALRIPRALDERVDPWSRHLEIIAQARMRFFQQLAHARESALVQCVHKSAHPGDLRVNVAPPFGMTRFGLAAALVVRRGGE